MSQVCYIRRGVKIMATGDSKLNDSPDAEKITLFSNKKQSSSY